MKYMLEEIKKNKTITMEDLLVKVKENTLRLIFHEGIWVEWSKTIILHWKLLMCDMNQQNDLKNININQKKEFYKEVKK